ncbi:fumarylacetoacetate hydrolase family protein [Salinibacillus xinjiangensis]|uniref:FAA hydrolase family protein n=1 Tax=Salinibacillus xinjiangensis TaxID=1229268 RepID=A0A6G1X601_9BACI|nr:fumarylacetoacetate hydrolase family protein [Salinibacillus xinjiangensis]MRG86335.1 FAA hydrolase family protein [Salinibacillus xinjiangensis]
MKLVSYRHNKTFGSYRVGAVVEEKIIDVNEAYKRYLVFQGDNQLDSADYLVPAQWEDFIALGQASIERGQVALSFVLEHQISDVCFERSDVSIGAPVKSGAKIICVGKNYRDHVAEMSKGGMESDLPTYPVLFSKFDNAIISAAEPIQKSPHTNQLDYEGELALVIGQKASNVPKEEALQYIAGYTIGNDVSARDLQKRTPQWLQGKTLDKSTPVGPWMVTSDEIPDPSSLNIQTFINGEKRQDSNTQHLIFTIPYLIEFISSLITLQPGDIILTGTPNGVGFAMDPPQFLHDGDEVRIEIEKVGVLQNRVSEQ